MAKTPAGPAGQSSRFVQVTPVQLPHRLLLEKGNRRLQEYQQEAHRQDQEKPRKSAQQRAKNTKT